MGFIKLFLGLCAVALLALFMWGLRAFLLSMDRQFTIGFGAGVLFLFALLWIHHKATGKNIFTDS